MLMTQMLKQFGTITSGNPRVNLKANFMEPVVVLTPYLKAKKKYTLEKLNVY